MVKDLQADYCFFLKLGLSKLLLSRSCSFCEVGFLFSVAAGLQSRILFLDLEAHPVLMCFSDYI